MLKVEGTIFTIRLPLKDQIVDETTARGNTLKNN